MRPIVPILMAMAASIAAVPAWSADHAPTFRSTEVDLPFGDRQFDGAGADAVNGNCLACHSAGMILNQPPLTRDTWLRLVNKMHQAYKAPIGDADVGPIVDYLMRVRGSSPSKP
jgi:mono/diheme cytochrome c family protein